LREAGQPGPCQQVATCIGFASVVACRFEVEPQPLVQLTVMRVPGEAGIVAVACRNDPAGLQTRRISANALTGSPTGWTRRLRCRARPSSAPACRRPGQGVGGDAPGLPAGRIVAARDSDYAGFTWYPHNRELDEWLRLYLEAARPTEANQCRSPPVGMGQAGRLHASDSHLEHLVLRHPADRTWWGGMWADRILKSDVTRQLIKTGAATEPELQRISDAWRQWAAAPDGWLSVCTARSSAPSPEPRTRPQAATHPASDRVSLRETRVYYKQMRLPS